MSEFKRVFGQEIVWSQRDWYRFGAVKRDWFLYQTTECYRLHVYWKGANRRKLGFLPQTRKLVILTASKNYSADYYEHYGAWPVHGQPGKFKMTFHDWGDMCLCEAS